MDTHWWGRKTKYDLSTEDVSYRDGKSGNERHNGALTDGTSAQNYYCHSDFTTSQTYKSASLPSSGE
ncbi:hypothetical protein Q5P01_006238 [Channa striata]|uniref:Uncharacterized protein n=1 Tax=Channa striata TaxID=64152 RepID=A0AA88SWU2_CHASR|nr:hypothetical protein Q5P01_006238 [Channa striata]